MGGLGDILAPIFIAEIGDVRRMHSAKELIAFAGIDSSPRIWTICRNKTTDC